MRIQVMEGKNSNGETDVWAYVPETPEDTALLKRMAECLMEYDGYISISESGAIEFSKRHGKSGRTNPVEIGYVTSMGHMDARWVEIALYDLNGVLISLDDDGDDEIDEMRIRVKVAIKFAKKQTESRAM
jgi:hypothetical protein